VNGAPPAAVVLDASALLALLRHEDGGERVAKELPRGTAISALNWAEVLARLGTEQPFTSFVFWPEHETTDQITAFAGEVVPEVRRLLGE